MMKLLPTFRHLNLLPLLLIFTLLSARTATTGATGGIRGRLTDEKQEGLMGAVEIIDSLGKATGQSSSSNRDGYYTISGLTPGRYDIRMTALGYQTTIIKAVLVSADKNTNVNRQLALQVITITDSVVAGTPPATYTDTKITQSITTTEIRNSGGLAVQSISSQPAGAAQRDQSGGLTITGGREDEVQYLVNGHRLIGQIHSKKAAKVPSRTISQSPVYEFKEYDMAATPAPVAAPDMQEVPPLTTLPVDKTGTENYKEITDNKFLSAAAASLSTFSIDVDVASYGITRRKIGEGILPPADAVRIEEMVNYFPYQYADPTDTRPFAVHTEFADCPWDATHRLLRIGIQGRHIAEEELPASNLVFLIDVSGSMYSEDKLPLVQKSLGMLVDRMRDKDRIALVVYAGSAGLVLPSTSGARKSEIKAAINQLQVGGSTAGGAGIELAYKTAVDNLIKGGNNRVMLCTDGDFNVGINGTAALEAFIAQKRETGVALSVLGYGMGNYKDAEMEVLADKGNGNYAYIDNEAEARKNLVTQLSGTLNTIAKDVKIQVVFNPGAVRTYRLIGYENRRLENRDFSNDKIDAGEIGASTAVTALYEVVLTPEQHESTVDLEDKGSNDKMTLAASDLMALRIRYKAPDGNKSQLIENHVPVASSPLASTTDDFRFAASVASFGMLLRNSPYRGDYTYDKAKALAKGALGIDKENYRHDFVTMIGQAQAIASRTASR